MNQVVFNNQSGQFPVVDPFPHFAHMPSDAVESLRKESHAGHVKQVDGIKAMHKIRDTDENVENMKRLKQNVFERKNLNPIESESKGDF